MADSPIIGLLHLLDRDMTAMCGNSFGLVTSDATRSTCATCLSIWTHTRELADVRALVVGDVVKVSH